MRKLMEPHVWRRLAYERFSEPLHMNIAALGAGMFGDFRTKVSFDLVVRPQNAFAMLKMADYAHRLGIKELTVVEFGVAAGAGLMNLAEVGERVTRETGVSFRIVGFDTGRGMPPPKDCRDHPELYQVGDYKMDEKALRSRLPPNVELIIGEVEETVPKFTKSLSAEAPLAYICLDLDYYSSSLTALQVLTADADLYLPLTIIYLDDLEDDMHNTHCGELAALKDLAPGLAPRVIERHPFLRSYRLMKNARWVDHIFYYHVVDHPFRTRLDPRRVSVDLGNAYLR
ncbi:MAG: hypothetical protein PHS14_05825 [Elusimicrobia bacterium]|nr:hypothetical protein [Elusimicrobiota bacterium]